MGFAGSFVFQSSIRYCAFDILRLFLVCLYTTFQHDQIVFSWIQWSQQDWKRNLVNCVRGDQKMNRDNPKYRSAKNLWRVPDIWRDLMSFRLQWKTIYNLVENLGIIKNNGIFYLYNLRWYFRVMQAFLFCPQIGLFNTLMEENYFLTQVSRWTCAFRNTYFIGSLIAPSVCALYVNLSQLETCDVIQ